MSAVDRYLSERNDEDLLAAIEEDRDMMVSILEPEVVQELIEEDVLEEDDFTRNLEAKEEFEMMAKDLAQSEGWI